MNKTSMRTFFEDIFLCLFAAILLAACTGPAQEKPQKLVLDKRMLDSIKTKSDSSYQKQYFTRNFATAAYYLNRKDATIAQVMMDKDSVVRQLTITKNKVRIFFAQFYSNGQQTERSALDKYGQYNGEAQSFYENGNVEKSGAYRSGFHTGKWKNFDSTGKYLSTDVYDQNGTLIKNFKE